MHPVIKKIITKTIGCYINLLAIIAPEKAAKKTFDLFSKPRKGSIGTHHETFLNPARKEKLDLNKQKIQVYVWPGGQETVLLVHGWESHSHRYKNLVERLQKKGYTIVAFDAPAHGYSDGQNLYVPLYHEALELIKAAYNPDYIIGHSIGAMTVIYNQYINPSASVKKLVILGAPDKLEDVLSGYQQLLSLSDRAMQSLDDYFRKHFGFIRSEFSSAAFAKKIKIPGLIIHDKDDKITPAYGSEAIHKKWKNTSLILTEGLNHSLYSDQVDKLIIDFINGEEITSKNLILTEEQRSVL